jgi:hypothetical protein
LRHPSRGCTRRVLRGAFVVLRSGVNAAAHQLLRGRLGRDRDRTDCHPEPVGPLLLRARLLRARGLPAIVELRGEAHGLRVNPVGAVPLVERPAAGGDATGSVIGRVRARQLPYPVIVPVSL